jgi:hypothetical protein
LTAATSEPIVVADSHFTFLYRLEVE